MAGNEPREDAKLDLQATHLEEGFMVGEDRWQEIRRLHHDDHVPIGEIARRLDLDRKTVRRCLKQTAWRPYQRPVRTDTLQRPQSAAHPTRRPDPAGLRLPRCGDRWPCPDSVDSLTTRPERPVFSRMLPD
jgi:hypothetical protein